MNEDFWRKVWKVLVVRAGAPAGDNAYSSFQGFLHYMMGHKNPGDCLEFRFMGKLGIGGKFWRTIEGFRVSCYSEDRTPERQRIIEITNKELRPLFEEWVSGHEKGHLEV